MVAALYQAEGVGHVKIMHRGLFPINKKKVARTVVDQYSVRMSRGVQTHMHLLIDSGISANRPTSSPYQIPVGNLY